MVPVVIEGVRKSLLTEQRVVTLLDQAGRRFMNVRVPRAEALTIAMHVYGLDQPHLSPIHFMARTLQSLHVALEEVQIRLLNGGIFYAVTRMHQGEIVQEGEAKPGEALGLAVLMKAPVVVAEEVLERMGMHLPEGKTVELFWAEEVLKTFGLTLPEEKTLQIAYGRQRGRDAIFKEITQLAQAIDQPAPSTSEELEQARQQVGDFQVK